MPARESNSDPYQLVFPAEKAVTTSQQLPPPSPRVLSQLTMRKTVLLRSPSGALSRATLKYVSGRVLKTGTRSFDAKTGIEVNLPEGRSPHVLLVPNPALEAEYEAQLRGAVETSRTSVRAPASAPE
jgi:hypothetical protein